MNMYNVNQTNSRAISLIPLSKKESNQINFKILACQEVIPLTFVFDLKHKGFSKIINEQLARTRGSTL